MTREISPTKGLPARQPLWITVTPRAHAVLSDLAEAHQLPLAALARPPAGP